MADSDRFSELSSQQRMLLKQCSLFSGFTDSELNAVVEHLQREEFSDGELILSEGNLYQGVWLLLRGQCAVVKHGNHVDSQLALLEAGQIFGEMSFLQSVPHSATVRSVGEVETLRLMRDDFERLAGEAPAAAQKLVVNLVRVLSDRLRRMDQWMCELVEREGGRRIQEWQDFRSRLYSDWLE